MEGFDAQQIYSSGNLLGVPDSMDRDQTDLHRIKVQFKEFIRQFHNDNFDYKYRYDFLHLPGCWSYHFFLKGCIETQL